MLEVAPRAPRTRWARAADVLAAITKSSAMAWRARPRASPEDEPYSTTRRSPRGTRRGRDVVDVRKAPVRSTSAHVPVSDGKTLVPRRSSPRGERTECPKPPSSRPRLAPGGEPVDDDETALRSGSVSSVLARTRSLRSACRLAHRCVLLLSRGTAASSQGRDRPGPRSKRRRRQRLGREALSRARAGASARHERPPRERIRASASRVPAPRPRAAPRRLRTAPTRRPRQTRAQHDAGMYSERSVPRVSLACPRAVWKPYGGTRMVRRRREATSPLFFTSRSRTGTRMEAAGHPGAQERDRLACRA